MKKVLFLFLLAIASLYAFDDGRDLVYNFNTNKWENPYKYGIYFVANKNKIVPYNSSDAINDRAEIEKENLKHLQKEVKRILNKLD